MSNFVLISCLKNNYELSFTNISQYTANVNIVLVLVV